MEMYSRTTVKSSSCDSHLDDKTHVRHSRTAHQGYSCLKVPEALVKHGMFKDFSTNWGLVASS